MPAKKNKLNVDLVNKILIILLLCSALFILIVTLYRQVNPPVANKTPTPRHILTSQPQSLAVFLMGESSYLYSKDVDGQQHIIDFLDNYLNSRLDCSYTFSTPTTTEFNDSYFRVWGDQYARDELGNPIGTIDPDINTIPAFVAAKNFVNRANNENKVPIVIIGHGANESKDIVNTANTAKTHDKFHSYLNQEKSILEGMGARVIFATPVKGCPYDKRAYDPEGTLKQLAGNINNWYEDVADVFGAMQNHSCSDTSPCPGPDSCQTRCLINTAPFNSPGFPNRSCTRDYAHPNQDGYTIMAKAIGDRILGLNLCPAGDTPTPTTNAQATPTPTNETDQEKLKKGDLNTDGVVNSIDWSIMKSNFFSGTNLSEGDLNEDGVINSLDWSIMKNHFWEKS